MTVLSSILSFIGNLIGTTSMGTTATTLTGAIAEVNAKTNTTQTATWADIEPVASTTNVLATFDVDAGKYLVIAECNNGLTDAVRVSFTIRAISGTTSVAMDGDANGYSGRSNWGNCLAYYEFTTSGTIRVSSYGKVGTDPILSGRAFCIKLM